MSDISEAIFRILFTNPSEDGLIKIIKDRQIRPSDVVPNVFEKMALNEVLFVLANSSIVDEEYRPLFMRMARIASHACSVEEELDHDTHEAVVKGLESLRL